MKDYLNLEKLIRIKVYNFSKDNWYSCKREIKFLGITLRKGGIYGWHSYYHSIDELENRVLLNLEVMLKPHCELWFEDGHKIIYWHERYTDALIKAEYIKTRKEKWITIDNETNT